MSTLQEVAEAADDAQLDAKSSFSTLLDELGRDAKELRLCEFQLETKALEMSAGLGLAQKDVMVSLLEFSKHEMTQQSTIEGKRSTFYCAE